MVSSAPYPVQWMGKQAVITLPEHIDVSNAGQIRDEFLALINRGAITLIIDMAATLSCDHAGAGAVARAYQRATASGAQLRLVVTSKIVSRVLSVEGLDRLVSIYPSLEAATAATTPLVLMHAVPGLAVPPGHLGAGVITPGVLWKLVDALADGVALTDDEGVLVLVNSRLTDMFGYDPRELIGRPAEVLVPEDLRAAHNGQRTAFAQAPAARPMGTRAPLVGLRKDGATFPVHISLSPVTTATGQFTLAVVRAIAGASERPDLAVLARAAATAGQARHGRELLDRIVDSLFDVGFSLQTAADLPHDIARQHITQALQRLDDTIHRIRDHVFNAR
jgi:anti-anti-sigma factor